MGLFSKNFLMMISFCIAVAMLVCTVILSRYCDNFVISVTTFGAIGLAIVSAVLSKQKRDEIKSNAKLKNEKIKAACYWLRVPAAERKLAEINEELEK